MKFISILTVTIIFLFNLNCCSSRKFPTPASGGDISIPGVKRSFCGDLNGELKFVLLAPFDVSSYESGITALGSKVTNSIEPSWSGYFSRKIGMWEYEVKNDLAIFGGREFDLNSGRVFILNKDFTVSQIVGSQGGIRHEEETLNRIGKLYSDYLSEQGAAGQSQTTPPAK